MPVPPPVTSAAFPASRSGGTPARPAPDPRHAVWARRRGPGRPRVGGWNSGLCSAWIWAAPSAASACSSAPISSARHEPLDGRDAAGAAAASAVASAATRRVQRNVVHDFVHQSDAKARAAPTVSPAMRKRSACAAPMSRGRRVGGAAVGYQTHPGEGRGERRAGCRPAACRMRGRGRGRSPRRCPGSRATTGSGQRTMARTADWKSLRPRWSSAAAGARRASGASADRARRRSGRRRRPARPPARPRAPRSGPARPLSRWRGRV